jgi:uroporphyrinogen-III synthase
VRRHGFSVHLEAAKHTAEGMVEALAGEGFSGKRFLLPRALEGREVIPTEIGRRGGTVEVVTAYRNGLPPRDEKAAEEIGARPPDVCTFASPSAFRNFFLLLGEERAASVLSRSRIAVIGEVTMRAVKERGYPVDIMPETYTLAGMLEAIEGHFASPSPRR